MRSSKRPSCDRTRASSATPFQAFLMSRSWLADSAWMRSPKRSRKSPGLLTAVCRAMACTMLSMFFERWLTSRMSNWMRSWACLRSVISCTVPARRTGWPPSKVTSPSAAIQRIDPSARLTTRYSHSRRRGRHCGVEGLSKCGPDGIQIVRMHARLECLVSHRLAFGHPPQAIDFPIPFQPAALRVVVVNAELSGPERDGAPLLAFP